MANRKLYLIRHGETASNANGVFRGRYDVPLNDTGRKQAESLRNRLIREKLDIVYSSPLKRAVETAEIISDGEIDIEVSDYFQNLDIGTWSNRPKEEIQKKYPDLWKLWKFSPEKLKFPEGETLFETTKRSYNGVRYILENTDFQNIGIVSHRAVIKCLTSALLDMGHQYFWKLYLDNAAFSLFETDIHKRFILKKWNVNEHLDEKVEEFI